METVKNMCDIFLWKIELEMRNVFFLCEIVTNQARASQSDQSGAGLWSADCLLRDPIWKQKYTILLVLTIFNNVDGYFG